MLLFEKRIIYMGEFIIFYFFFLIARIMNCRNYDHHSIVHKPTTNSRHHTEALKHNVDLPF